MRTSELPAARRALDMLARQGVARVVCAVSGGVDSMCLLHLLAEDGRFRVCAAHFNHGLRPTALRDEAFVRDWCAGRGVAFFAGRGDPRALAAREHLTLEEAGRALRYGFLEQAVRTAAAQRLLTAHHADDSAETMLLNLLRGTGARGLSGIPARRGVIARPFLGVTRGEIETYAAAHAVPHVEDETNALDDASRNVLRHKVLPVLKELNPRAVENMARTAALLASDDDALSAQAEELLKKGSLRPGRAALPLAALQSAPEAVRTRAVLELLARTGGRRRDLTRAHVAAAISLPPGGQASLPCGLLARREGETLVVARAQRPAAPAALTLGQTVLFGRWRIALTGGPPEEPGESFALSAAALAAPVSVTRWDPRDRMALPGARGSRSLKRLCAERGITPPRRDALAVVRVGAAAAAVPGVGRDTRFSPSPGGERIYVTFYTTDGGKQPWSTNWKRTF